MFAQFTKYAAAGAAGTAVQYALLFLLVESGVMSAVPASTCGAAAGAIVNYMLNYRYTFRSRRPHTEASLKYLLVSLAGIALNAAVVALGTSVLGLHYLVAQVVATGIVLVIAFATNRAWTF
ncbi:MAG TPA: GtrA family protein [Casimicrobiaceae bacterium]